MPRTLPALLLGASLAAFGVGGASAQPYDPDFDQGGPLPLPGAYGPVPGAGIAVASGTCPAGFHYLGAFCVSIGPTGFAEPYGPPCVLTSGIYGFRRTCGYF